MENTPAPVARTAKVRRVDFVGMKSLSERSGSEQGRKQSKRNGPSRSGGRAAYGPIEVTGGTSASTVRAGARHHGDAPPTAKVEVCLHCNGGIPPLQLLLGREAPSDGSAVPHQRDRGVPAPAPQRRRAQLRRPADRRTRGLRG